jgi:hypothetical protein
MRGMKKDEATVRSAERAHDLHVATARSGERTGHVDQLVAVGHRGLEVDALVRRVGDPADDEPARLAVLERHHRRVAATGAVNAHEPLDDLAVLRPSLDQMPVALIEDGALNGGGREVAADAAGASRGHVNPSGRCGRLGGLLTPESPPQATVARNLYVYYTPFNLKCQ